MARIRTLKPEFWDSPSTAQADLAVRLAFMAMWNWADDSGHGTANLKELEAFAFPNDEVTELPRRSCGDSAGSPGRWRSFAEVCGEVQECYEVVFYKVKGRPYYWIPSFKGHQSRDFRPTSKYPTLEEGQPFDIMTGNKRDSRDNGQNNDADPEAPSAPSCGDSAAPSGDSAIGTGEQGNRGTVEQLFRPPAPPKDDADEAAFNEWYSSYPRKEAKGAARKAFKAALKKADLESLKKGLDAYRTEVQGKERQHIAMPASWLNAERWGDDYTDNQKESDPWAALRASNTQN